MSQEAVEPLWAWPPGLAQNELVPCKHCTSRTHETRRCCVFCGHWRHVDLEACLCEACLREPRPKSWEHRRGES